MPACDAVRTAGTASGASSGACATTSCAVECAAHVYCTAEGCIARCVCADWCSELASRLKGGSASARAVRKQNGALGEGRSADVGTGQFGERAPRFLVSIRRNGVRGTGAFA
jgi:hypothetical protein